MLVRRVVTAAIGLPILLILVYLGGWPLIIATAIFQGIAIYEVAHMFRQKNVVFFARMGVLWVWGMLACQAFHFPVLWAIMAGLALVVVGAVVLGREASSFEGALTTSWASLYIGLLFSLLVAIRELQDGQRLLLAFFVVIWLTDTMAFFIGRRFGRKKLMVHVSPGKTWEGTAGGIVAAVAAGLVLAPSIHLPWYWGGTFALLVSVSAVVGDLFESQLKRYVGVKDSGGFLPGHGGILDRFDSALFALPFAYYLLKGLGIS